MTTIVAVEEVIKRREREKSIKKNPDLSREERNNQSDSKNRLVNGPALTPEKTCVGGFSPPPTFFCGAKTSRFVFRKQQHELVVGGCEVLQA